MEAPPALPPALPEDGEIDQAQEGPSFKIFLGGVSYTTTEESLRGYLEQFGEVLNVVIMTDRNTGRPRGFGFATFADEAAIHRVISESHVIDGRVVEAKVATPVGSTVPRGLTEQGGPLPINTKKVFVGGLPPTITNELFKEHFDQFGPIDNAIVMVDRMTERSRGFGFVTFANCESVPLTLQETHLLDGKKVEVKSCFAKQKNRGRKILNTYDQVNQEGDGKGGGGGGRGGKRQPARDGKGRRKGRNANHAYPTESYGTNEAYAYDPSAAGGYGGTEVGAGYPDSYPSGYVGAHYSAVSAANQPGYMATSPYEQYKGYMYGAYQQQMMQSYGAAAGYTPQQQYTAQQLMQAQAAAGADPTMLQRSMDPLSGQPGHQEGQLGRSMQQMVGPAGEGEAHFDQQQMADRDSPPGMPIGMSLPVGANPYTGSDNPYHGGQGMVPGMVPGMSPGMGASAAPMPQQTSPGGGTGR
jgi:RNA recognition motif-containing protein